MHLAIAKKHLTFFSIELEFCYQLQCISRLNNHPMALVYEGAVMQLVSVAIIVVHFPSLIPIVWVA